MLLLLWLALLLLLLEVNHIEKKWENVKFINLPYKAHNCTDCLQVLSSSRLSSFSDMGSGMTVGAKNGESFDINNSSIIQDLNERAE